MRQRRARNPAHGHQGILIAMPATAKPSKAVPSGAGLATAGLPLLLGALGPGLAAQDWQPRLPQGQRFRGLAHDVLRNRTVLFTGDDAARATWEHDGANWRRVATSTAPTTR